MGSFPVDDGIDHQAVAAAAAEAMERIGRLQPGEYRKITHENIAGFMPAVRYYLRGLGYNQPPTADEFCMKLIIDMILERQLRGFGSGAFDINVVLSQFQPDGDQSVDDFRAELYRHLRASQEKLMEEAQGNPEELRNQEFRDEMLKQLRTIIREQVEIDIQLCRDAHDNHARILRIAHERAERVGNEGILKNAKAIEPDAIRFRYGAHIATCSTYAIACEHFGLLFGDNAAIVARRGSTTYYVDGPNWGDDDQLGTLTSDYFVSRDLINSLRIIHDHIQV